MIIKGSIEVNGSNKKPVLMTSLYKDKNWKGYMYLMKKKEKQYSKLQSLRVNNTQSTQIGILNLTGGTTFYNTKIFIDDLEINNSIAEDALNIVNGDINISKLNINRTRSDGFDCDFCEGNIDNLNLERLAEMV